jgi:predicted phage tail protein
MNNQELIIYGEGGGGKGGGGHTPSESPDTLVSKQTVRLLFAISEGEITGIDDIYTNNTSVQNYARFQSADLVDYPTIDVPTTDAPIQEYTIHNSTTKRTPVVGSKIVNYSTYTTVASTSNSASNLCAWLASNSIIKDTTGQYYKIFRAADKGTDYFAIAEPIAAPGSFDATGNLQTITYTSKIGAIGETEIIPGFDDIRTSSTGTFPVQLFAGASTIYTFQGDIDAVVVTLMIDRLMLVEDDGDRVGYYVGCQIAKGKEGDSYGAAEVITKEGKCTSPYSWGVRINRPDNVLPANRWNIYITRTSVDDADDKHYSKLYISGIQQIVGKPLPYPRTALLAITLTDPDQFGGSVPDLKFKVRGMRLPLPNNYSVTNPFTASEVRTYNETTQWDGGFSPVYGYTDNPAWILYGLLRGKYWDSPKYDWGLGIPASDIDLGSFYTLAKYCDNVVPHIKNGSSVNEFRYTAHFAFYEREDIPTMLMKILTLCNANLTTNEFGQISVVWDAPGQAITKIVTNANVIDGAFSYSSTDMESRTTVVNVTYNRDDFNGDSDTVTVEDNVLIDRYGYQTADIILMGCKSEAQAIRKARWALYTNCFCTEIITFRQLFQGATYHIGELIQVTDSDALTVEPKHGVITAVVPNQDGSTTVQFDRTITTDSTSGKFTFYIHSEDSSKGQVFTVQPTITTEVSMSGLPTTLSQLTYTFAVGKVPFVGTTFSLSSSTVPSKLYKVVKIDKDDDQNYTITANLHTEDKYSYIDGTLTITEPSLNSGFSPYINYPVAKPTNLVIGEVYAVIRGIDSVSLELSWDWVNDSPAPMSPVFIVEIRRGTIVVFSNNQVTDKLVHITDAKPGTYTFKVLAMNPRTGLKSSTAIIANFDFRVVEGVSSLVPPTGIVVNGSVGTTFDQPDLNLAWDYPTVNDTREDRLCYYQLDILTLDNVLKATYVVKPKSSKSGGRFLLSLVTNTAIFGSPTRSFKVKIYSRDQLNDLSVPTELTVSNSAPIEQDFSITNNIVVSSIKVTTAPEPDQKGYLVWRGTTDNFVKNDTTLVYKGDSNPIELAIPTDAIYYYAVAAYDSFGTSGIIISSPDVAITGKSAYAISITASDAKLEAAAAQADATASKAVLQEISKDYKITQGEKGKLFLEWKHIYDDKPRLVAEAATASVSSTSYVAAYTALAGYLTASPLNIDVIPTDGETWCSDSATIVLVDSLGGVGTVKAASEFRLKFLTYYASMLSLRDAITKKASDNAGAAQSTANSALSNANTALDSINSILDDNKVTQAEKSGLFADWKAIYDEYSVILGMASSNSVNSTSYQTAYTNLVNLLTVSPLYMDTVPTDGASWCANTSVINLGSSGGANVRLKFSAYYSVRSSLLASIDAALRSATGTALATGQQASSAANLAQSTANTAITNAAIAQSTANTRMSASAANVLSGSGTVQVGDTTNGVLFTSNGLLGKKAGVTTFSVDTTGTAVFAGNLSGAHGSFGDLTFDAGGYLKSPSMAGNLSGYGIWFSNAGGVSGIEEVTIGQATSGTTLVTGIAYTSTTQRTKALFNDASNWAKFGFGTYSGEFSGNVYVTGAITATGNITAYSDIRLKTNLQPLIRSIDGLTGYSFDWNGLLERGEGSSVSDIGLLADEVALVLPEAVFMGEDGYKTVDYTRVIPLIVEELKALKARVKELEDDSTK